jgi:hypothetical protein
MSGSAMPGCTRIRVANCVGLIAFVVEKVILIMAVSNLIDEILQVFRTRIL